MPAEIDRALVGSAHLLKNAAAICDLPALWTHAKTTLRMLHLYFLFCGMRHK